jgi:hypothetical protein
MKDRTEPRTQAMVDEQNERPPHAQDGDFDGVDNELLTLPEPPPSIFYGLFTLLIIVMSVVMLYWFRDDFEYLLQGLSEPTPLGDASEIDMSKLEHNTFVTLEGIPWVTRSITMNERRWFFSADKLRVFPIIGQASLFVQWIVPQEDQAWRNPKTDPSNPSWPGFFRGRLVRHDRYDRSYIEVWRFIEEKTKTRIPKDGWLLIDGEEPWDKAWVVAVYLLFTVMIVLNGLRLRNFWLMWRS